MSETLLNLAEQLRMTAPEQLWGVSSESVYLALAAAASDRSLRENIEPCYRASVLATNDKRARDVYADFHARFLSELELTTTEGRLTDLGRIISGSEDPLPLVRHVVVLKLPRLRSLLRNLTSQESVTLTRREFDSLLRDEYDAMLVAPLITSLEVGNVDSTGYSSGPYQLEESVLFGTDMPAVSSVAWTAGVIRSMTGIAEPSLVTRLVEAIEDVDNVDPATCEVPLKTLIQIPDVEHGTRIALTDIEDGVAAVTEDIRMEKNQFRNLLDTGHSSVVEDTTFVSLDSIRGAHEDIGDSRARTIHNLLWTCTQRNVTEIPVAFLSGRLGTSHYDTYRFLNAVPGVSCELEQVEGVHVIAFDSLPAIADGSDCWDEIVTCVVDRLHTLESFRERLDETTIGGRAPARYDISVERFERIDESVIEPTYFAYTLPDPSVLGEATMDRFVGESEALSRERAKLNRWTETETADSRRFTELTDRLVSKGLEEELEERVLRIMTPYDDDTFSEYASQFRQLVRAGYEIRLLTRHTREKWQWERLRDNLIRELDSNRDNVTIRTYSRYKEYQRITEDIDPRDLDEFGIHAKLQTIGHAEEGAALLGSANFMENSYDWNPECGAYTENENFVTAALEFFDFVWELASADEVDLDRLQEIPKRDYFPSYYT